MWGFFIKNIPWDIAGVTAKPFLFQNDLLLVPSGEFNDLDPKPHFTSPS
jgi:hypothetical protein